MNVCIIQPPYSRDTSLSDEYFQYKLSCLEQCDESIDLIVLPEYSDVPCATSTWEETLYYHDDPEEAKRYLAMGVDSILTNDYLTIYNAVRGN